MQPLSAQSTARYLKLLGVREHEPLLSPFDPGYDLHTLTGHLDQSAHLMSWLKISMACWMIADERVTRAKVAAARAAGVRTVTGGGPFEIAAAQGQLSGYLDLCADLGFDAVEAGHGFTDTVLNPERVVADAALRGLAVHYELGGKHDGQLDAEGVDGLVRVGRRWTAAGAVNLVVEARESACSVGLFGADGRCDLDLARRLLDGLGDTPTTFEAPTKASQFALLDHLGPGVRLANVRLEEILRVEIYRRGLHSDSFGQPLLTPAVQTRTDSVVGAAS